MAHDGDDEPSGDDAPRPQEPEVFLIDDGNEPGAAAYSPGRSVPPSPARSRFRRIGAVVGVAAVFVFGIVVGRGSAGSPVSGSPKAVTSSSMSPSPGMTRPTTTAITPSPAISTSETTPTGPSGTTPTTSSGRLSWLDAASDWSLFAYDRSGNALYRIEAATGRVTKTPVPRLRSSGPVYVVATNDAVFVHPLDRVPGYVIDDGKPAQRSAKILSDGGALLPGPQPDTLWAARDVGGSRALEQFTADGTPTGTSIPFPDGVGGYGEPDGAGGAVIVAPGGFYHLHNDRGRYLDGQLLATGPKTLLTSVCHDNGHCNLALVDQSGHGTATVAGILAPGSVVAGATSPGGSRAALLVSIGGTAGEIVVIDSDSGAVTRVGLVGELGTADAGAAPGSRLAWSPSGRWLFVAVADGITAVDTETGKTTPLWLNMHSVAYLALRPALSR